MASLSEAIASLSTFHPGMAVPTLLLSLRTPADETALHVVISAHPAPMLLAEYLLAHGHSPSVRGHGQHLRTPLHEAARRSDEFGASCAQLLLDHGAPVNAVKSGDWTPLMVAALAAVPRTVKLLLGASARVDLKNKEGATATHLAAKADSAEALALILHAAGAEAVHWQTCNGRTPLHYAARSGSEQCVDLLLKKGANIGTVDKAGMSAAHEAAAQGEGATLMLLLKTKPGQQAARKGDVGGLNVLHHAAVSGGENAAKAALQVDPTQNLDTEDARGQTALFLALWHSRVEVVNLFTAKGASLDSAWIERFRQVGREESATLLERLVRRMD